MAIKRSSSFEKSQRVAMEHFLARCIRIEEILGKVGISDEEAAQGQHTELADRLLRVITLLYKTTQKALKEVYQLHYGRMTCRDQHHALRSSKKMSGFLQKQVYMVAAL